MRLKRFSGFDFIGSLTISFPISQDLYKSLLSDLIQMVVIRLTIVETPLPCICSSVSWSAWKERTVTYNFFDKFKLFVYNSKCSIFFCVHFYAFFLFQGGCFLSTHKYDTKKNNQEKSYTQTEMNSKGQWPNIKKVFFLTLNTKPCSLHIYDKMCNRFLKLLELK